MLKKHTLAVLFILLSTACACIEKKPEQPIGQPDTPSGEVQKSADITVTVLSNHALLKVKRTSMPSTAVALKVTVNGDYYGWFLPEDTIRIGALDKTPEKNKLVLVFTDVAGKVVGTKSYLIPFKEKL